MSNVIRKFMDRMTFIKDSATKKHTATPGKGMWVRTEVIGGYGDVHYNPRGKSSLGEVVFSNSNTVPLGGVQYVFEQVFGVQGPITIPTLYDQTGIGLENSPIPVETFNTPFGERTTVYRLGNKVCLFGVGVTGTAENDVTVYPVDYRENSISLSKVSTDGATINGLMIPFRYTSQTLDETERKQYFGKYTDESGTTGYYLKAFEVEATIKHIWKTGKEVDDETEVATDEVWQNVVGVNTIESFVEIVLKISSDDVTEWYSYLDQLDNARINTIALYTGEFVPNASADGYGDFRDCTLFSKLNIPVEYLSLSKDLNIIYRVYGS